jgi:O-6-methylguanine DNA methyltransferase
MNMSAKGAYPTIIETIHGQFVAWFSEKGLTGIDFPNGSQSSELPLPSEIPAPPEKWVVLTRQAIANALAGKPAGTLPPLDLSVGTPFQREVWKVLTGVPCGSTISYGAIAKAIGRPQASRAVGAACGANPIPVLVPCHRVLASNSRLGGFSGGLDWKRKLLNAEGVTVQS